MYLSRLTLDPRHRDTRRWLSDCHQLHRTIMSAFPHTAGEAARAEFGVLFRVETSARDNLVRVYVQSRDEPRWALETHAIVNVEGPKDMSALANMVADGKRFRFRLRANPTRRVHARALEGSDDSRMNADGKWVAAEDLPDGEWNGVVRRGHAERSEAKGKRVEIRGEEERIGWLQRQGERCGFRLARVTLVDRPVAATRADPGSSLLGHQRNADRHLTFGTALFEGDLQVTDEGLFLKGLAEGIGPGKAFGCGMLSIMPIA